MWYCAKQNTNKADTLHHAPVGRVCDGVDVRGHLVSLLALVHVHYVLSVDGQVLVWVDHHTEETRIRLREAEQICGQRGTSTHTHSTAVLTWCRRSDSRR